MDLKFVTGDMNLPKRATNMAAREAAEVNLLSDRRLRLGVGTGWSEREYGCSDSTSRTGGRRIEERITLQRELWR